MNSFLRERSDNIYLFVVSNLMVREPNLYIVSVSLRNRMLVISEAIRPGVSLVLWWFDKMIA